MVSAPEARTGPSASAKDPSASAFGNRHLTLSYHRLVHVPTCTPFSSLYVPHNMLLHISLAVAGLVSSKQTTKSALSIMSRQSELPSWFIKSWRIAAHVERRSVERTPRACWATWLGGVRAASLRIAVRLARRARSVRAGRFFESRTCSARPSQYVRAGQSLRIKFDRCYEAKTTHIEPVELAARHDDDVFRLGINLHPAPFPCRDPRRAKQFRVLGHVERDAAKVVGFELGGAEVVHERERGENERSGAHELVAARGGRVVSVREAPVRGSVHSWCSEKSFHVLEDEERVQGEHDRFLMGEVAGCRPSSVLASTYW